MVYRLERRERIVLQYLMVLNHRNITPASLITIKRKKPSKIML